MPYKFRDIEKKLKKLGFEIVRQKGSHVIFSNGKTTFLSQIIDEKIYLHEWKRKFWSLFPKTNKILIIYNNNE